MLTHGELFAGISGFGLGFERAGLPVSWAVEIDPHCRAVLRKRHPEAMVLDDVREVGAHNLSYVDVISFGSPCQDLSVAGRRAGLDGRRSGLFFEATRIIGELRPKYAVWENVPGALSSNAGRDFGAVLDALAECGAMDICWRMLDAQYFGLAQRRLRLFVVASFRAGLSAAQILFEPTGGDGDSPPRREAGEGVAGGAEDGPRIAGIFAACDTADTLSVGANQTTGFRGDVVAHIPAISGPRGGRSGEGGFRQDLDNHGAYIPIAFDERVITSPGNRSTVVPGAPSPTLNGGGLATIAYGVSENQRGELRLTDYARQITAGGGKPGQGYPAVMAHSIAVRGRDDGQEWELGEPEIGNALRAGDGGSSRGNWALTPQMAVRRLTPLECERLQGFPDGWTEGHSDSTRYRMLGNAVAVPVAEWIGKRLVENHSTVG